MEARGHFGELAGEVYAANYAAGGNVGALHQSAAIGERSLAEHIEVARLIHNLRQQEHARLEVVGAGRCHPARGDVRCDELHFREEGVELALGALYVVRQRLDGVPGDVGRGTPLALQRFLVQRCCVVQPNFRLRANSVAADAICVGALSRAARPAGHVIGGVRRLAVRTYFNAG